MKMKNNDDGINKEKLQREHVNRNNWQDIGGNTYIKILKREHVNPE